MSSPQLFILCASCLTVALASDTPVGHLMPFGNHKPPSVIIDEFTTENAPKPPEFFEKYVKPSKAAIFRGAITDSKAFKLWTDSYIRENFGENEVRLEGKKEKQHLPPVGEKYLGRDTLRHFVDTYHDEGNKVYIVSDLPNAMYRDVDVLPSLGACGEMSKRIVETDIWWSGGGSSSIIHKDAFNQINCLVNGTKYWKLIEYKYEKDMYQHKEAQEGYGGFSDVKPMKVNLLKFPKVKNVEWSNITIYAGDCLFLPKSYYHQVESSGTHNLAVSLLFSRFDDFDKLDFSDCKPDIDYKTPKTLDNYDVMLVWKGNGTMVMGRVDLWYGYRQEFIDMAKDAEKENIDLDYDTWVEYYAGDEPDALRTGELRKAFEILDKDSDGYMTTKDVMSLTLKDLQAMSDELEPYEPSNHYIFEYSIMAFDIVWKMLNDIKKNIKVLSPARWEKIYTARGGTKQMAHEIFTKLAKGKEDIFMHEVYPIDMWNALENWVTYWAPQYSELTEKPTKKSLGIEEDEGDDGYGYDEL